MAFSVFDIPLHIFIIVPEERRNVLKDGRKLHKCLYCSKWVLQIPEHMKSMPEAVPLTSGAGKLQKYLITEIETVFPAQMDANTSEMSSVQWSQLQRVTVARIITFNARRGGEPSKLLIKQWENADAWKRTEDIENLDDPVERILAKRMKVVYVVGKRKRRVPILFCPEMMRSINARC